MSGHATPAVLSQCRCLFYMLYFSTHNCRVVWEETLYLAHSEFNELAARPWVRWWRVLC